MSSLGRIYLMFRTDLVSNKRILVTFFLALISLTYFLPRLYVLTTFDLMNFLHNWVNTYSLPVVESLMTFCGFIYFWVYVNRRILHSYPTYFSTLPAKLWEKLASIALYGVVVWSLCFLASRVEFLVEYLTVPNLAFVGEFWDFPVWKEIPKAFVDGLVYGKDCCTDSTVHYFCRCFLACLFFLGGMFMSQSLLLMMMTHIRQAFIGLFCSFLSFVVLTILLTSICIILFQNWAESLMGTYSYLLFCNAYVWCWASVFIWICKRRLNKISS